MRVTILSYSHILERRGGAEYQCDIISREFYKLGHDVSYIFVSENIKEKIYNGVKLLPISQKRKLIPGKNHFLYLFSVLKRLRESKPEIIYVRNLNSFIGFAAFYKLFKATKIALHIAVAFDLDRLKYKIFSVYSLSLILNNSLTKFGIKSTDIVFGQEHWHIKKFKELYGSDRFAFLRVNKIYEIKNVSTPKRDSNLKTISWVGNIKPVKRIDLLFNVAKELENDNVIINVIGRNDFNGIKKDEFLKKLELQKNIIYRGDLNNENVLKILSKSHCLLHTSDFEGGPPMVFIEAWSLYTPVISLNINPDNIFENFEDCFSDGDINKLVLNIKKILNDEELRIKNGKIGNKIVKKYFSKNNIIEMLNRFKDKT